MIRVPCYDCAMRWVASVCSLIALGSCNDDVYFIPGTGEVPECNETPVANLEGTVWTDRGLVTIRGPGCDVTPGVPFRPCGVYWAFRQDGNEVTIIVDGEYRIEGRFCGDELHLRGGWWLQLQLGLAVCQSRDDLAGEVSIQAEGNVLRVSGTEMTGTLAVQGGCALEYEVALQPVYFASRNRPLMRRTMFSGAVAVSACE